MVNEAAILDAIADLESQSKPNFNGTAKKYDIDHKTLKRRFEGKTASKSTGHLEAQGLLNAAQERVLIDRINTLSARGMPPTPRMIENLVQELTKGPVGDRWVSRFTKRHDNELASIYLESIDYARRVADNSKHFNHYFMLVSVILATQSLYISLISSSLKNKFENTRSSLPTYTIWTRKAF